MYCQCADVVQPVLHAGLTVTQQKREPVQDSGSRLMIIQAEPGKAHQDRQ